MRFRPNALSSAVHLRLSPHGVQTVQRGRRWGFGSQRSSWGSTCVENEISEIFSHIDTTKNMTKQLKKHLKIEEKKNDVKNMKVETQLKKRKMVLQLETAHFN